MDREQLAGTNITLSPEEQVKHLAKLTKASTLDGIVCSAREAKMLRETLGPEFLLVTPGIRPAGSDQGDQHRVMTPADANAMVLVILSLADRLLNQITFSGD